MEEKTVSNQFAIIGDANSGLDGSLRSRFGIDAYVPGKIMFPDGSDHDTDLDWKLISAEEFYGSMKNNKAVYKTGVVPPERVEEVMEPFLKEGRDILSVTLSSRMSSTYNVFLKARKDLLEKYPERNIRIVDSLRFSTPIAMMNMKASEMRAEGKTLDETADWLEENRNCFRQMGPMNDLMFLARTGRITNFKAFFGTLAGVNALGDFDPTGISQVLVNVKGVRKALTATVEYVKRTIVDPQEQIIFIGNTLRDQDAQTLKQMVEETFHPKEVLVTRVDINCGANVGPGMVGVYYLGRKASQDLTEEKQIMNEIAAGLK